MRRDDRSVEGVRPPSTASFACALVLVVLGLACSSKAALVGSGGQCEAATDCQEGLVCIPQKNGTSVCSSDLSGVQQLPAKPADAAAPPPVTDAAAAAADTGTDSGPTGPAEDATAPPAGDASGE